MIEQLCLDAFCTFSEENTIPWLDWLQVQPCSFNQGYSWIGKILVFGSYLTPNDRTCLFTQNILLAVIRLRHLSLRWDFCLLSRSWVYIAKTNCALFCDSETWTLRTANMQKCRCQFIHEFMPPVDVHLCFTFINRTALFYLQNASGINKCDTEKRNYVLLFSLSNLKLLCSMLGNTRCGGLLVTPLTFFIS